MILLKVRSKSFICFFKVRKFNKTLIKEYKQKFFVGLITEKEYTALKKKSSRFIISKKYGKIIKHKSLWSSYRIHTTLITTYGTAYFPR